MSVDHIEEFRNQQQQRMLQESDEAAQNTDGSRMDASNEVRDRYKTENEATCESYVAQHLNRDDNPALFDTLKQIVMATSIHNMNHTEWTLGEQDSEGLYSRPQTSGRRKLEETMATLLGNPPTPERVEPDETPEIAEARTALETARTKLAELSVQRRRKLFGKLSRHSKIKDYEDAVEAYNTASVAYGVAVIAQLRSQGVSEENLLTRSMTTVIEEHDKFNTEEKRLLNDDATRRGKFARFFGKTNKRLLWSSLGLGLAVGVGVRTGLRYAAGSVGLVGGVVTGAVAGGVTGGLNSLATNRAYQYNQFDGRAEQDHTALQTALDEVEHADTTEETHKSHVSRLIETITGRVNKDQNANLKRFAMAVGAGAVTGAGGALIMGEAIDHHWFGWGDHSHAASTTHHPKTPVKPNYNDTIPPNQNPPSHAPYWGSEHHHHVSPSHSGHPGHTDGFKDTVRIEHGQGEISTLQNLAGQKHIHLSGAQADEAFKYLANKHGTGSNFHLFTNVPSEAHGTDTWISRPAAHAHLNPQYVHEFNEWLKAHNLLKTN